MTIPNYVPNRKICIDGFDGSLWDFEINVNRKVWRSLTFAQQHLITTALQDLKHDLNATIEICYKEVNQDLADKGYQKNVKTNTETNTQTNEEANEEANIGTHQSGEEMCKEFMSSQVEKATSTNNPEPALNRKPKSGSQ